MTQVLQWRRRRNNNATVIALRHKWRHNSKLQYVRLRKAKSEIVRSLVNVQEAFHREFISADKSSYYAEKFIVSGRNPRNLLYQKLTANFTTETAHPSHIFIVQYKP